MRKLWTLLCVSLCLIWPIELLLVDGFQLSFPSLSQRAASVRKWRRMADASTGGASPGAPLVLRVDEERLAATVSIAVDATATERAFAQACRTFNQQVADQKITVPGFPPGLPLPPYVLFDLFNRRQVVEACGFFLQREIQQQIAKLDLPLVGKGRVLDFHADDFQPGQTHAFELVCDLWPRIEYVHASQYRGLTVRINKHANHSAQLEAAKLSLREKHRKLVPLPSANTLDWGLGAIVDMEGFFVDGAGNKGPRMSGMKRGEELKIVMQRGRHMEGLVEGLIGASTGETRSIKVKFPPRTKGPGSALSGMEAIVDVTVKTICESVLPDWDDELAAKVKEGLSAAVLEQELLRSVEANDDGLEERRNQALSKALLGAIRIEKVPPNLVETQLMAKFEDWLRDCKKSGLTEKQFKEISTNDNFAAFKELHRGEVEDAVRLGIAFRDVAMKERISVTEQEVKEQMDVLKSQLPEGVKFSVDVALSEIESVLLRLKVCECLANYATIEYIDAGS